MTAFTAGIQDAIPGVIITITSVSAARRRLLASGAVTYTASSATASTSALAASLSSPATIAAVSSSLVAAGYPGVVASSPVFSSSPSGTPGVSAPSGANAGTGGNATAGAIAGGVIGGLLVIAAIVGGTLFHIVHVRKTYEWIGCELRKVGSEDVSVVQPLPLSYADREVPTESNPQWTFFSPNQPTIDGTTIENGREQTG